MALFVLLIAAQAVVLALLYSRIKHFAATHTELRQIDELRAELHGLHAAALDAETGQRGFVITGREEFLQPYRAAVLTFQPRCERLRILRQPELALRVETLLAQLRIAQADLAHLVELRRHDGFAAAQQKMLDGAQRESMDLLRTLTRELDEEELRAGRERLRSSSLASAGLINLALGASFCGLLLLAGLGGFVLARLGALRVALGRPLVELSRDLRAAAKTAAQDAGKLAAFAQATTDAQAEGQAALDVITHMAKELSAMAMALTSSVRAVAEEPEVSAPAAPLELIVTQAGRLAQSALSLELTAAEQCRVLNGSAAALLQLEQSARSGEQAASRLRKLARGLLGLLQESPGRLGKRSPASGPLDGSDFEIAPLRT
ncbi:MAG TPA: CHASE3 domain-containing protein [Pseudomonadota bacterium]|nr:CHASE3 domain-containing protein [Pseudomonadota bacterium]